MTGVQTFTLPIYEQKAEEMKKKLKDEYDTKLRNESVHDEHAIRARIKQEFEYNKKEAQLEIDRIYEEKYATEHNSIEQNMTELKRVHNALLESIRKLKSQQRSTIEEYEAKDFELTKQEIETRNRLESVEQERRSKLLPKRYLPKDMKSTFATYREPFKENSFNYSCKNLKGKSEWEFADELSRILPNPDEVVDKAINDIGVDDIITKVMEGEKGQTKKEDYLIQDQNDLADIVDY